MTRTTLFGITLMSISVVSIIMGSQALLAVIGLWFSLILLIHCVLKQNES